jgi:hypothetical protein
MSVLTSVRAQRLVALLLAMAISLPVAAVATAALHGTPQVIQNAACKGYRERSGARDTSSGCNEGDQGSLAGFVSAANAVVSPAVIAMAAIAPIACLIGAGALMFGNRKGITIIGAALGTLVFVISIRGIVA